MKWSIITSTALFFAGCASTTAPSGWLPYPEETMYDSRGGWIDLRLNDGKGIGNSMISSLNNDNGNIIETSSNTNTGGSSPSYGYSLDLDIPYSFGQDIIPTSGYDI